MNEPWKSLTEEDVQNIKQCGDGFDIYILSVVSSTIITLILLIVDFLGLLK